MIRSLLLNGYEIDDVERTSSRLDFYRIDTLGGRISYSLLLDPDPSEPMIESFLKRASSVNATPLALGSSMSDRLFVLPIEEFFRLIGGSIDENIVYDDSLPATLDNLGHNRLPKGLLGEPDDLLEEYVKQSLQFITARRTKRYGSDRRFESVPDGLVLEGAVVQFDAKAYKEGFPIASDDIKRFAAYVRDFNSRYEHALGRVFSFLVVSGHFADSDASLDGRRKALYAACQTNLSCLNARDLGDIVLLLRKVPSARRSIAWGTVFSGLRITPASVRDEIGRVERDGVV